MAINFSPVKNLPDTNKLPASRIVFYLVAVTVFSLIYQGGFYGLGISDHGLYVPFVKYLNQPDLYPRDLFIKTVEQYFTVFWQGIALLTRFLPQKELFIGLHFLARLGFIGTIYYLARSWQLEEAAALLATTFLALSKVFLNFPSLSDGLVHSEVAWPLLLFSLALFWREKYIGSAVLAGLAFNIHPLLTAYLMFVYLILLIYRLLPGWQLKQLHPPLIGAGIFLLLALPSLLWVGHNSTTPYTYPPEWLQLNIVRNKHFLNPRGWGLLTYLNAGFLALLFGLGCQSRPAAERVSWWLFGLGVLLLTLLGISPPGQTLPFLVKGQFIRAFLLLYFPAFILMAGLLYHLYQQYPEPFFRLPLYLTSLGLLFCGPNSSATNLVCLSLGLLLLLAALFYAESKPLYLISLVIGASLTLLGLFNLPDKMDWLLIDSLIGAAIFFSLGDHFRKNRLLATLNLSLALLLLCGLTGWRVFKNQQQANGLAAWKEVQLWSKDHTPPASLFITPPELEGWQILSERGTVLDWKGLTSALWAPANTEEWSKRLADFGYDLHAENNKDLRSALQEGYRQLTPARFSALGQKYGASYIVTAYPQSLPFEKVYQNSTFRVYYLSLSN